MQPLQLKDFVSPHFSSLSWIISLSITIVSIILNILYDKQVFSKVNLQNVHLGGNLKNLVNCFLYTLPILIFTASFIISIPFTINLLSVEVNAPVNLNYSQYKDKHSITFINKNYHFATIFENKVTMPIESESDNSYQVVYKNKHYTISKKGFN
jgi:hypothetical protein